MTPTLKTLTPEETFLLLDQLLKGFGTPDKKAKAVRNHTMAVFMLDAGLRVGELIQLRRSDLMLNNEPMKALRIRAEIAKCKYERIIPLSEHTQTAIVSMQENWWSKIGGSGAVYAFYNTHETAPITTRQVERIIKAASLKALGRTIHPHILRHTFATRMMRVTSMPVVQQLLGHKQLSSTQIYTHPNHEDLQEAIDKGC